MIKIGAMKLYVSLFFFISVAGQINMHAQQNGEQPYIKVEGEVTQSLKLYQSDLDKMKRVTVSHKGHDSITNSYTGVPLIEILSRAGVTMGKQLRGKNMAKYLLVNAADGYQVVFSLAELDTSFNEKEIILADKMNNKPMPSDPGPFQLIVPGEKRPARSCCEVVSFIIRSAQ
jgi:DMSO/TMAO reductase YedYZ molybdopterin-dependent catalytic subunit